MIITSALDTVPCQGWWSKEMAVLAANHHPQSTFEIYLYRIPFYKRITGMKLILLTSCFKYIGEVFSVEAITVELNLMFVTVKVATQCSRMLDVSRSH